MIEFSSLGDFAHHLVTHGLAHVDHEVKHALADAADILETEAKGEFGQYQAGAGPFGFWPELSPVTKADRLAKGFTENDPLLRTGVLRDATVKEVSATEAIVGSTDPVMEYQELGTARIPPRPVFGIALQRHLPQLVALLGSGAYAGLTGATRKAGTIFVADGQTTERLPGYQGDF